MEPSVDDLDEATENRVDLIASGYEWVCPKCLDYNKEIETKESVICQCCGRTLEVGDVLHAIG